ncbi:hypothetical protein [Fervidobacterium sp.]
MEERGIARRITLVLSVGLLVVQILVYALDFSTSISYNFGDSVFSLYNNNLANNFGNLALSFNISHQSDIFQFLGSVGALNDGVFNDPFANSYYAGFYFVINESGIRFNNGPLKIAFGKLHQGDIVDSPYSLFISSFPVPRNQLDLTYDDGKFIYVTRWIELTNLKNSSDIYEKLRSANYKVYAVRLGNLRFGYQDVTIYVGKNFDFEYFANPVPSFFIQYVNDAGRPYPEGAGETNSIMGFFADYTDSDRYWYAQILVDDINVNRFLHPESYQNPDKIAWSLGGRQHTNFGILRFYHAGATKYTFQPSAESGNQRYYGYTYYTDFTYAKSSTTFVLPLEMLYAGYKYGENNLAFLLSFTSNLLPELNSFFELVVLGERSPINPWNDRTSFLPGTHLLEDEVKEFRFISTFEYSKKVTDLFRIGTKLSAGYVWNSSVIVPVDSDNVKKPVLRPLSGNNFPFFSVNVTFSFSMTF